MNEEARHKFVWKQDKYGNWILDKTTVGKKPHEKLEKSDLIDNSVSLKLDSLVMTEWGVGKVTNSKLEDGTVQVKIEENQLAFSPESIKVNLDIYLCILCKDSSYWVDMKIDFGFTIQSLKQKISQFIKCHPSQIVIIHSGAKVDKKNQSLVDIGVYEKDVFLIAIKDPQELSIFRCKSSKLINKNVSYNALKFSASQDIIFSAIGFYKNKGVDLYYDLYLYEEQSQGLKMIYSEKKILVKKDEFEENEIYKYKINNIEIKENTLYQIHQYLNTAENNQFIGTKGSESMEEKTTLITLKFFNCEIPGKENSSDLDEGMIPAFYFFVKTDI